MIRIGLLLISFIMIFANIASAAAAPEPKREQSQMMPTMAAILAERRQLFEHISAVTGIPWFYLAAIDQYERSLSISNPKKRPLRPGLIAIYFTELAWVGMLNPDHLDDNMASIRFFNGYGRDGSGDGLADRNNDLDVLFSMAASLKRFGTSDEDLLIGIWEYYHNVRSVERIAQFAKIYAAFGTLALHEHAFPLPRGSVYSFRSTWGANRNWGGYRIHEGTDIFADTGVPVRSTCYGIIEEVGWNRYGGWRIGIRDLNGVYHYFAHLSRYNKKFHKGDLVTPAQIIGYVGSSGYGKPGTAGKFPPHLHYGLYRDNGLTEWSFDPYSYLRKWEREDRNKPVKQTS